MSWITDINHYDGVLEPTSTAPSPAKNIARFMGSIVQAATAWPPDYSLNSAIHCRRRPKNKACPGHIILVRVEHDENGEPTKDLCILWECGTCKDNGVIRNWVGTEWDFSDVERDPDWWDNDTLHLTLTEPEYLALREELTETRSLFVIIILAMTSEHGPVIEVTLPETQLLVEGVFQAMKRASGKRKNVLEGVMNKLHGVILGQGSIQ